MVGKHVKEGNAIRVGKAVGWERGGREREGDMEGGREGGEMREREREGYRHQDQGFQTSLFSLPWQPSQLNCGCGELLWSNLITIYLCTHCKHMQTFRLCTSTYVQRTYIHTYVCIVLRNSKMIDCPWESGSWREG